MSAESIVFDTLNGLVAGRVFPDVGPEGVELPYITFQQVGGSAINFMSGGLPSKRNCRMQINVWSATRLQAALIARQAEDALRVAPALQVTVLGAQVADYEPDTKLYGTRQDFSLWTD